MRALTRPVRARTDERRRRAAARARSEKVEQDNLKIDVYDLGGGKNIRKIWERYYAEVHGCIFVVDASDEARLEVRRRRVRAPAQRRGFPTGRGEGPTVAAPAVHRLAAAGPRAPAAAAPSLQPSARRSLALLVARDTPTPRRRRRAASCTRCWRAR